MNDESINKLNMIGACINVARDEDHLTAWQNVPPLAFGTGLAALEAAYGAAIVLAARVDSAITGTTDAKTVAETILEDLSFRMARGLVSLCKATGDLVNLAKVDVVKSDLVRLRHLDLTTRTTEIRDLATGVAGTPAATDANITPARIAALTAAIGNFETLRNAPRSEIVSAAALRRELETDLAGLLTDLVDLDDLLLQFDDSEPIHLFHDAWKEARMIIDAGHGPHAQPPTTPPPTPPTPPTP